MLVIKKRSLVRKPLLPLIIFLLLALPALTLFPAKQANAADISGTVTYPPSGAVVGTFVGLSTNIATFTPSATCNVTAGSTITLTFPVGTVLNNIVASDFTIIQAGGGAATAPSGIAFDAGARTITFTVNAASLAPNGQGQVTIATSGTSGGDEIRHPTAVTTTGSFSVATSVGDTGTINNVVFIADAANKLVITSAALNQATGTQGTITVQVQDQYGNPVTAGVYTVNLASNSAGVNHFYTTGTQTIITSINIGAGVSTGTFDYYDELVGTPTITVTDAGAVLTQDTQQQTITAGAANKLVIISAALNQAAGTQGTVTVQVQDQFGNPVTAGAFTVNLASNSAGVNRFFTTGTQTIITSINIAGGVSNGTFDYYDEQAGTPTITVTDAGAVLTQDAQQQTITVAAANRLVIISAALNQIVGTQGTITVQVQDQFGNPVTAGAFTVNLASNSLGVNRFYTTGTQIIITSINIGAGANNGTFDYYDEQAGTPNVTVTDARAVLTQGAQQQTITGVIVGQGLVASAPSMNTPNPPRILVPNVNVQPQQANANQAVTIYANLVNRGEMPGTYTAQLKINGEIEQTESGDIGANMGIPLKFTVYKDQPGTYDVEVNGQKSSFTIIEPVNDKDASTSRTTYLFIITLIIVILVAAIFFIRHLKQPHYS